jgi:uncharacterized protein YraI
MAPMVATNVAYIRKGPGQGRPVVSALKPARDLNVQKCVSRSLSGLCEVGFAAVSGWVHGSPLKRQGALFN